MVFKDAWDFPFVKIYCDPRKEINYKLTAAKLNGKNMST